MHFALSDFLGFIFGALLRQTGVNNYWILLLWRNNFARHVQAAPCVREGEGETQRDRGSCSCSSGFCCCFAPDVIALTPSPPCRHIFPQGGV